MLYAFLFISVLLAAFWLWQSRKYAKFVRGEEPHTQTLLVDLPFDDFMKHKPTMSTLNWPGAIMVEEEVSEDISRLHVYAEPEITGAKPMDMVTEVTVQTIGGTKEVPIVRIIEQDGQPYPRGKDHYATEFCIKDGDKTMMVCEERGTYPSTLHFLGVARGCKNGMQLSAQQTVQAAKAAQQRSDGEAG